MLKMRMVLMMASLTVRITNIKRRTVMMAILMMHTMTILMMTFLLLLTYTIMLTMMVFLMMLTMMAFLMTKTLIMTMLVFLVIKIMMMTMMAFLIAKTLIMTMLVFLMTNIMRMKKRKMIQRKTQPARGGHLSGRDTARQLVRSWENIVQLLDRRFIYTASLRNEIYQCIDCVR